MPGVPESRFFQNEKGQQIFDAYHSVAQSVIPFLAFANALCPSFGGQLPRISSFRKCHSGLNAVIIASFFPRINSLSSFSLAIAFNTYRVSIPLREHIYIHAEPVFHQTNSKAISETNIDNRLCEIRQHIGIKYTMFHKRTFYKFTIY